MPGFDPKGFKHVGDYLLRLSDKTPSETRNDPELPPSDAVNRTIVGRYYYSAFLQLRKVLKVELNSYPTNTRSRGSLEDFLNELDGPRSHKAVALFLEKLKHRVKDLKLRQAHNSIMYLRGLRNAADYDLSNNTKIKQGRIEEPVDFSKKEQAVKSLKKYESIERLLEDSNNGTLKYILRTQRNTVIECIEEVIREL
ncbi:hypothetical protein A3L12_05730 [Thermococcus sp. P6]|uniref:hypothetical protein n=1 Tax=Thermococcus sp. P6 TaxID=122420 RepID=UPI000B59C891|nr:hypothetical protein [Thermococcus sp. P6]ASJ10835.1 hypothetical protein A3L12_05730 [Thermococcus sp. P6]